METLKDWIIKNFFTTVTLTNSKMKQEKTENQIRRL